VRPFVETFRVELGASEGWAERADGVESGRVLQEPTPIEHALVNAVWSDMLGDTGVEDEVSEGRARHLESLRRTSRQNRRL